MTKLKCCCFMFESLEMYAEIWRYSVEATLGNLFVDIVDEDSMAFGHAYCYLVIAILTENGKQKGINLFIWTPYLDHPGILKHYHLYSS